jgi:transcriptional regulator
MSDRPRNRHVSHVARANDHAAIIETGARSTAILMDRGAYVSSSWYPAAPARNSAPTWAFRVVHFHGRFEPLSDAATARHLNDLVHHMETGRPDRWRMGELGPGGLERRLPSILGYELVIDQVEVRFKLGQDERPRDMAAAETHLRAEGHETLAHRIRSACRLDATDSTE